MLFTLLYFISCIIVGILQGLCIVNNDKLTLNRESEVFAAAGAILLWPLWLSFLFVYNQYEFHKNRVSKNAEDIVNKYNLILKDTIDREKIVSVEESKLKYLLKASRKGYFKLSSASIIIIREELMHRNAERSFMS